MQSNENLLSVIIVNYNTKHLLSEFFSSLNEATKNIPYSYCLVDNASIDGSSDYISENIKLAHFIINDVNVGFGRANNQCLDYVDSKYVLLVNTDAFVEPDTITKTIDYMEQNPGCGILGVRLVGRNGELQPSCRYFPTPWTIFLNRTGLFKIFTGTQLIDDMDWSHAEPRVCDWVPGCYYLVRKEVIEVIGLFDPIYFLYYEEVDHCLSAKKAGWEVHYFPYTSVIHLGGESAKSEGEITESGRQIDELQIESEMLYFRKNYGIKSITSSVLLHTIADILVPLKRLFMLKKPFGFRDGLKHMKTIWFLFFKTRYGSVPTR